MLLRRLAAIVSLFALAALGQLIGVGLVGSAHAQVGSGGGEYVSARVGNQTCIDLGGSYPDAWITSGGNSGGWGVGGAYAEGGVIGTSAKGAYTASALATACPGISNVLIVTQTADNNPNNAQYALKFYYTYQGAGYVFDGAANYGGGNYFITLQSGPTPTVTAISPNSGPVAGGTSVTITGTNFTGATTVAIGGAAATNVTVIGAGTSITATTPAGTAGTASVMVATPGGASATNALFTYVTPPVAGCNTSIDFTGAALNDTRTLDVSACAENIRAGLYLNNGIDSQNKLPLGFSTVQAGPSSFDLTNGARIKVTPITSSNGISYDGYEIKLLRFASTTGALDFNFYYASQSCPISANCDLVNNQGRYYGVTDTAKVVSFTIPAVSLVATTTTVTSPGAITLGNNVTYTATISNGSSPGGTVAFKDGATDITGCTAVAVASATATCTTTPASAGTHTITAVYSGDATNATSTSADYAQVVNAVLPTVTGLSKTSGPVAGGTFLTITGTGFTGVTAVKFGAASGTGITVVSATSITVTAPAGSGTVDVRVTTPGGTSATSASDQFTYFAVPTVTSLSPKSGPAAGGNSVTINGTGLTGATAVKFGANAATGITVVSATQITVTAPAGSGNRDVRVTTPGGTSDSVVGDLYSYIGAPRVTGVSPGSGPAAGGISVTITGTDFTADATVKFGANAATGITVVSATQITATAPAGTGDVVVQVTTPNGTSTRSGYDGFSYIAAPVITSISPNSGPTAGGTHFTITGTGFTGVRSVNVGGVPLGPVWSINSDTQIDVTAPAGTGTVDVTVTTAGGTSATSANAQFTYVAAPTVTSISPISGPLAGGTSVTISGTGFTGATGVKFGATPATGITVSSATQITATAPAGSAGTVDVTVTTPGGTSATSASDQYTYIAAPVLVSRTWVSRSGNDANACSRSAPCLTFAGAFANTLAGGEINCLDSGDYGAVTITRAVAIVCDTAKAHIRVAGSDGIVVNAGASDAVTLSGLDIAADPTNTAFSGIRLLSAGSLAIADTQLRGFAGANYAVTIVPTVPTVTVLVDRVSVASSTASSAGGLLVSPASGGTAKVSILHSRFDGSAGTGVRFDSVGKTGVTIAALIQDSLLTANNVALLAKAPVGTGTISLTVLGSTFSRNSYGASINGAVTALFGDSTISTNGTGLAVMGGAVVRSAGDNRLGGNTSDGAFTAPAARR